MGVIVHKDFEFIVQGITGREALNFTRECLQYGSKIVGGVTPGRGGREVYGVPVYDTVREITSTRKVDGAVITVPLRDPLGRVPHRRHRYGPPRPADFIRRPHSVQDGFPPGRRTRARRSTSSFSRFKERGALRTAPTTRIASPGARARRTDRNPFDGSYATMSMEPRHRRGSTTCPPGTVLGPPRTVPET